MTIKVGPKRFKKNGRHAPERGPGAAPVHLSHVEIHDVRIFEHLELDVPKPSSPDEGQWVVILGENGTGKTTLLRCLASVVDAGLPRARYVWRVERPPGVSQSPSAIMFDLHGREPPQARTWRR